VIWSVGEVGGRHLTFQGRAHGQQRQDRVARISRQPLRPKVVTHVAGTLCYLCLRAGPPGFLEPRVELAPTTGWLRSVSQRIVEIAQIRS
jgi:hypothetical protein